MHTNVLTNREFDSRECARLAKKTVTLSTPIALIALGQASSVPRPTAALNSATSPPLSPLAVVDGSAPALSASQSPPLPPRNAEAQANAALRARNKAEASEDDATSVVMESLQTEFVPVSLQEVSPVVKVDLERG